MGLEGCHWAVETTAKLLLHRRFYLEVVARRRFKILSSWEQDGYRMAQPRFFHDDAPAPGSAEAARTAELALTLASLADAWVDRVKYGPRPSVLRMVCIMMQASVFGADPPAATSYATWC